MKKALLYIFVILLSLMFSCTVLFDDGKIELINIPFALLTAAAFIVSFINFYGMGVYRNCKEAYTINTINIGFYAISSMLILLLTDAIILGSDENNIFFVIAFVIYYLSRFFRHHGELAELSAENDRLKSHIALQDEIYDNLSARNKELEAQLYQSRVEREL